VYAGSATRVVVDADDATLTALLLNVSTDASKVERGSSVTLTWEAAAEREMDS